MPEQRRRSDELLRQQQLFRNAPGFIAVLRGPDHVYEFVNDAYVRIVGRREYIGKPVREVVPEAEAQGFVDLLDKVYKTATRHVAERARIVLRPDPGVPAEEHFVDFVYEPMLNDSGKATAIFVEGFESAHFPNAPVDHAKECDRVWANSRDLLVVIGAGGVFQAVSPAWTKVLGHAPDEVIGRSVLEFVYPDDAAQSRAALDVSAGARDLTNFENRFVRKDGAARWISWHTSVEGDLVYAYGRDITAEKRSADALAVAESRLRAIFETTYLFQGLLTPAGVLLDANTTALSAIGKTLEQVLGKAYWDTEWFTGTAGMAQVVQAAVHAAGSGNLVRQEIHVNLPVGGWRWFDFSLRPVFDGDDRVVALVPEALELTERKLAEAALHQSQKLDAMGQLTGGVAHDFNNLLVPIVGSLDMLQRRGIGGEREQRLIVNALKSAERAKLLVQRLLAFARRQPLQPEAVHVGTLIEDISALIDSTTGPQIAVKVDIERDLPTANADPSQLEMAILNLSVNARDAMPQGGMLRISARCRLIEGPHRPSLASGRYICVSVEDSGHGMDPETLSRAIEPFFSTKGIGKGTGLGLSMVHGLASQLGGALHLSSEPGAGTTVELWLPVRAAPVGVAAGQAPAAGRPLASGTALLVDDEEIIRVTTADMLNDLGFVVIEAASALEALAILKRGDPVDILITDHLMPGMTGVSLAKTIMAERPGLPVLIVSGFADVEGLPSYLPRLSKPFRQADLASVVQDLVSRGGRTRH